MCNKGRQTLKQLHLCHKGLVEAPEAGRKGWAFELESILCSKTGMRGHAVLEDHTKFQKLLSECLL